MIKVIGDAPRVLYKFMSLPEHVDAICAGRVRLTTIEICRNIEDPGRADRGGWMNWKGRNGGDKPRSQVDFAEFIEKIENDIADVDGFPTSLQMHAMATEFVARQDMALKSTVRVWNKLTPPDGTDQRAAPGPTAAIKTGIGTVRPRMGSCS